MLHFPPAAGLVVLRAAFAEQPPQPYRLTVNVDLAGLGNTGIAAHHDKFFRPLRTIRESDIITLTPLSGASRYRAVSSRVVNPSNVPVLQSDGREILTIVTCARFYFIAAVPKRFIVRAEMVT